MATVIKLLNNASSPLTGPSVGAGNGRYSTVQATVAGTGSVAATVVIEVSNIEEDWLPAGTITLSGSGRDTDGFVIQASWANFRARLVSISGTNAAVTAALSLGA